MKVAIMQPYIFPYIGYFQLLNSVDKFVFLDDVNFIKKGWINRNQILSNGQAHLFTIPLQKASQNVLIKDTRISYNEEWNVKILKNLENNYKKAPHFETIFPLIKDVLEKKFIRISDLAINSIQVVSNYLDINSAFELSSENYLESTNLKKEHRLIKICAQSKSKEYINLIGGKDIYDRKDFLCKGIELKFLSSNELNYKQLNNQFVPHLSVIDILMFNSIEEIKIMLNQYELV